MSDLTGYQLIDLERRRQIESEGWTSSHDDSNGVDVLELAAVCYRDALSEEGVKPKHWPWSEQWWKPKSRQRNLVRAGALFMAAADTADRAKDYQRRDSLRGHVTSCAILLDGITAALP